MKKLAVTAVAFAVAISANAATIKWGTDFEVGDGTEDGFTSATVAYLVNSSVLSQTAIYDAVMGGMTLADAVSGKTVSSASMSGGAVALTTVDGLSSGSMTAYMVLFDSDLNAIYFSEQLTKTVPDTGSAKYGFSNDSSIKAIAANMSAFSTSKGGWVGTAAVPEPTSGLLMLLGMAGLALRRRRA